MSDANPKLGNPAENLAHLIGEAISDDVDAWDWLDNDGLKHCAGIDVSRDGRSFRVMVVEVEER